MLFGHAGWGRKFHDISRELALRSNYYKFSGITFGLESHKALSGQLDLKYESLKSYEELYMQFLNEELCEDYLQELEERYGNLWRYAYADRQLITYNHTKRNSSYDLDKKSVLRVVQGVFRYYEDLITGFNVDVFLVYATGSVWAQVSAAVAEYYSKQYYELITIRHPDRLTISKGGFQKELIKLNESCSDDYQIAEQTIQFLEREYKKPVWIRKNIADERADASIAKFWNTLVSTYSKERDARIPTSDPGSFETPFKVRVAEWVRFKLRYRYAKKLSCQISDHANIIFMPLHYEPEASLSVRSLFYSNQLALIENISKSIPYNYTLVLKEHPQMSGLREISFYKRIERMPNAEIASVNVSSREIIDKCKMAITLTGTAGYEAALLGKPVLMFGTTIFNDVMPGVYGFNGKMGELPKIILNALNSYSYDRSRVVSVLAKYIASSWDVSQKEFWEKNTETQQYRELITTIGDILEEVLFSCESKAKKKIATGFR